MDDNIHYCGLRCFDKPGIHLKSATAKVDVSLA